MLFLLSGFLVVKDVGWWIDLRNVVFFSDLFLMLGVELVDVLLNIGPNDQHVIDKLVTIGPCFRTVAVVFNKNVFFFESMVVKHSGFLCS